MAGHREATRAPARKWIDQRDIGAPGPDGVNTRRGTYVKGTTRGDRPALVIIYIYILKVCLSIDWSLLYRSREVHRNNRLCG